MKFSNKLRLRCQGSLSEAGKRHSNEVFKIHSKAEFTRTSLINFHIPQVRGMTYVNSVNYLSRLSNTKLGKKTFLHFVQSKTF